MIVIQNLKEKIIVKQNVSILAKIQIGVVNLLKFHT